MGLPSIPAASASHGRSEHQLRIVVVAGEFGSGKLLPLLFPREAVVAPSQEFGFL